MTIPGGLQVRFRKGGTVFHVYGGENAGLEGVWLAQDGVEGIYDAPVKTTWKSGAFQDGSRQKARKWLQRDMELAFHVIDTVASSWQFNDSEFRRIFDYQLDQWEENPTPTVLEVETELSGVRKLDVLMYEEPEFHPKIDPHKNQHGLLILKLRAGEPFWYENDNTTATGFPESSYTDSTDAGSGFVTVSNPTDQVMYQKWILTPATWELPDNSWVGSVGLREPGGEHETRTVDEILVTSDNGIGVVDLDGQELMFRDSNDTNILAQLAGKFFNFPIPPYTPETELQVVYSLHPGGAMVRLVQPRRWSRPWGLELAQAGGPAVHPPQMIRFVNPGASYSFTIPEWCNKIDVVLLGGGGGGGGGTLFPGIGGGAGQWATATLTRGVNIPFDTLKITGLIGGGGWGGELGNQTNGGDGEPTTANATGMTPLSGAGGEGSVAESGGFPITYGQGAEDQTFNNVNYPGSSDAEWAGVVGNTPGGGGSGGWPLNAGANGARGQAWFRAYIV